MPTPHGAPDYYQYRQTSRTFPLSDMAELASRLGALQSFDRRGDFLWGDNFDAGLSSWDTGSSADAGSVIPYPHQTFSSPLALRLTASTTSPYLTLISRRVSTTEPTLYGVALAFRPSLAFDTFNLAIVHRTPASGLIYELRIDYAAEALQINPASGPFVTIADVGLLSTVVAPWYLLKFVFDIENQKYVRAIWGFTEIDISSFSPRSTTTDINENLYIQPSITGDGSANQIIDLDTFILTHHEPP